MNVSLTRQLVRAIMLAAMLALITACGGGNNPPPPPDNSNNWDSMVWDQNNWS